MGKIFHIYASQGRSNYAELDLPASDYEMLDLMERLRLEPGQPPYLELLKCDEKYDYLDECIHGQPDIYQLNALARKLAEFTSVQDMASFEGLVGKEIENGSAPIELPRLIDFAYSTDCCHVAENAMTDFQLGKFLVENDFIEEANGLPESMLALLDYGKIGREHREAEGGVYTGFGYVEQHSEVRHVSETMDFQPRKPDYTVLLNMASRPLNGRIQDADILQVRLPALAEQMQEVLEKLGAKDWNDVIVSILDCAIPERNHEMYLDGEVPQIMELAQCLQDLDARGELSKYKALLAAEECNDLSRMISLAGTVSEYMLEPKISAPEDVARGELGVILCDQDAEALLPYIDLISYGRSLLERDHAKITGYGLLELDKSQPVQDMGLSRNNAPDYTILLEVSKGFFDDPDYDSDNETQLRLPATPEDLDKALDAVDVWDWREVGWSCLDCQVPALIQAISDDDESGIDFLNHLARQLADMEPKALKAYSAFLEAAGCPDLQRAGQLIDMYGLSGPSSGQPAQAVGQEDHSEGMVMM